MHETAGRAEAKKLASGKPSFDPENFGPGDMKKVEIQIGMDKIIGYIPSEKGNAALDYHKSVDIFVQNEKQLNSLFFEFDTGECSRLSPDDLALCEKIRRHAPACTGGRAEERNEVHARVFARKIPADPGRRGGWLARERSCCRCCSGTTTR